MQRVNYYNQLDRDSLSLSAAYDSWRDELIPLRRQPMCKQKVYFFDTFEYTRWFPQSLKWKLCPWLIPVSVPNIPSIVKSRPLVAGNENSVIMKLDKVRHFIFIKDEKSFVEKKKYGGFSWKNRSTRDKWVLKKIVIDFLKNIGDTLCAIWGRSKGRHPNKQWIVEKMTLRQHLDYKFILSLEGNDVASNLKWVMSSNSLAVMPRPTCETWFMEGRLIPNYHYVEIKPDSSDLEERLNYYIAHPQEAEEIIRHAHEYVEQFKDPERVKTRFFVRFDKVF